MAIGKSKDTVIKGTSTMILCRPTVLPLAAFVKVCKGIILTELIFLLDKAHLKCVS